MFLSTKQLAGQRPASGNCPGDEFSGRPDAKNLVHAQRLQSPVRQGGDFESIAERVQNFDGIAVRAVGRLMLIHQLDNITAPQTLIRQVATQSSFGVEWQFNIVVLSGSKVTNFVEPDKRSVNQMVRTRKVKPFGPCSLPTISK